MAERKSYHQFCALARGLDVVGDRWTLLVVRELLLGARSFRQLQDGLAGISPNLLTDRLQVLQEEGLVARNNAPARSKSVVYTLTDLGGSLEGLVFEFIRWGARWMATGPGTDRVEPQWSVLALRALLEDRYPGNNSRGGVVHVDVEGTPVTIELRDGMRAVRPGHLGVADATVTGPVPDLLAVASGIRDLGTPLQVQGDRSVAVAALSTHDHALEQSTAKAVATL
jgi:DNA-binding HxlR family transcriptional regulator